MSTHPTADPTAKGDLKATLTRLAQFDAGLLYVQRASTVARQSLTPSRELKSFSAGSTCWILSSRLRRLAAKPHILRLIVFSVLYA